LTTKKRKIFNVLQHYQQFFHNKIRGRWGLLTISEGPVSAAISSFKSISKN